MLAWLHKPTEYVTPDARKVLALVAREWAGYSRERRASVLAQLVWEIRWDGPKNRFTVMLDETAIRETWLALEIQRAREREERRRSKQPPQPRRRRARRG